MRPRSRFVLRCLREVFLLGLLLSNVVGFTAQAADEPARHEVALQDGAFRRGTPIPAWARTDVRIPENRSAEPALVRLSDTQVRVGEGAFLHRVLTGNDASTLSALGQYEISFMPEYQRVELHSLRVLRGNAVIDKLHDATIRFMQVERDSNNSVFTGGVNAVLIVGDLRPGDSLDLSYTILGDNPVFAGRYFDGATWEGPAVVALRRLRIDMPAGRELNYRFMGGRADAPAIRPRISTEGAWSSYTFEQENIPAVDQEQGVPQDVHAFRWLQLSEFSSWTQVSDWALDLFRPQPLGDAFKPILADIARGTTPEQKVMRALAFVQNEIRYVSVAFGESSHRPAAPAEVLQRRYGDCKDKSALLVALLREQSIEANPVLLSTQFRRNADGFLPSPHAFNHAIVRVVVGGKAYFVDPTLTHQYGSLAVIGDPNSATQVLVVRKGSDRLDTTPGVRESLFSVERRETVTLRSMDGPADMNVVMRFSGLDAERFRQALTSLTPDQLRKYYQGLLDRRYSTAELVGEPRFDDDRERNQMTVTVNYRVPGLVETVDKAWSIRFQASNLIEQFFVPNSARRSQPIVLPGYPFFGNYEFILTLPDNFDANRRPYDKTVNGTGFSMAQHLSLKGRQARAQMALSVTDDRVPAAQVPQFLSDMRAVNPMLSGEFSLDREDMRAQAAPAVPYPQSVRQQLDDIVRESTAQIDRGIDSHDNPLNGARCNRALAQARLGKTQEALADAEAAQRSQPDRVEYQQCLGIVQFVTGALAPAVQSGNRVIGMGKRDFEAYYTRGLAQLYLNRFNDAADDFLRAFQAAATPAGKARADYWRMLAMLRGGEKASALQTHTAWPGPAIALLEGRQTTEQMLQAVMADNTGPQLEATLAEAYLAIGQYHALAQRRLQSRSWFRQSLEKGALFNVTHFATERELER